MTDKGTPLNTRRLEFFMRRCFDLAYLGAQYVRPNPMVGAVIVHQDRIIGEGYHKQYGSPHAEVHAIRNVAEQDQKYLADSEIYISLEPCSHFGKTPPCVDLILSKKIPRVCISCVDPNPRTFGKGVRKLRNHGVHVKTGILAHEGHLLIKAFESFYTHDRPYVILKYAQSKDGIMGRKNAQIWISNPYTTILSHKLRSEVDAILIGTNTAEIDNPGLTNRHYFGNSPMRVILDRSNRLPRTHQIFNGAVRTLIYTETQVPDNASSAVEFELLPFGKDFLPRMLSSLHRRKVQVLMVEGGSALLQSFLKCRLWDEAWIVTSGQNLSKGIKAPVITGRLMTGYHVADNVLQVIQNPVNNYPFALKKPQKI